jgi:hypothetical protein
VLRSALDFVAWVSLLFPGDRPPKKLHVLLAADAVRRDAAAIQESATRFGTSAATLKQILESTDPFKALTKQPLPDLSVEGETFVRRSLGQLLIGGLAERAFEEIYRHHLGTTEFKLEDDRTSRSDTDYKVLDGAGRPVFRVNIKFHGSQFRQAKEHVNLEPSDCFALATYKIYHALRKQEQEHLSYIFLIVGVPGLTGASVGASLPEDLVHFCSAVRDTRVASLRAVEDAAVAYLLHRCDMPHVKGEIEGFHEQIRSAPWYALSARRASSVMTEKLFDRVFALRVRSFARSYRNAELDMHFSLSGDLTPLEQFLRVLREDGIQGLTSRLERGTF